MTGSAPRAPFVSGETGLYPVLPLRDIVVFPHMIVPLFVGREKSIRALEEVVKTDGSSFSPPRRTLATTIPTPPTSTRSARSRACCSF